MKIAVVVAFAVLFVSLMATVVSGRSCARRIRTLSDAFPGALLRHMLLANATVCLAIAAVLVTELMVRMQGGVQARLLFVVHLSFALPFLIILLTIRFYITGLKNPTTHRKLAYICVGAFVATLVTGMKLLFG